MKVEVDQRQETSADVGFHAHAICWVEPRYVPMSLTLAWMCGLVVVEGKLVIVSTVIQRFLVNLAMFIEYGIV